jgi:hypothetical protein
LRNKILERTGSQRGLFFERQIELRHVGGVVFVVVKLHRFGVDEGFERVVIVAQRGEFVHFARGLREGGWGLGCTEGEGACGERHGFESVAAADHRFGKISGFGVE